MDSRQLDVRHLGNLVLPYDVQTKELADGARIVGGNNTYINKGGKLAQAPGLDDTNLTSYTITGRVDRIVSYETSEGASKVYLLASVFTGAAWEVQYCRVGTSVWASIGSLRGVNASIAAHEFSIARGRCYIRHLSLTGLVTTVFDGTGGTVTLTSWGLERPLDPSYSGNFGATTTTARFGWRYAYAYVNSTTGHVSSRSLATARTGAISGSNPRIHLEYSSDTTVDFVNIYRTFDGGGTFYFIDQVANVVGGGFFNYDDNGSGVVAGDSIQDAEIDTRNIAPSEISNEPPPTDLPSSTTNEVASAIAYFARRHWYGIGNTLFYSGQEEITNGVPEESFPGPTSTNGNHYILKGEVRQLVAARRAFYVTTSNEVMILVGQDKTNFLIDTLVPDVAGAKIYGPGDAGHAIVAFRDSIFFLSADHQIYSITGTNAPELISEPLGSEFREFLKDFAPGNNMRVEFELFSRDGNTWLIVNCAVVTDPQYSRQYVYDLTNKIWFTPWQKQISAMVFGKMEEGGAAKELIVTHYDGTTSKLAVLSFDYLSDVGTNFVPSATINLTTVPSGNHINELRKWAHVPMLSYFIIERTVVSPDSEPTVAYRLDEFTGATTSVTGEDPPYLSQHTSYFEKWYPIQLVCKRAQLLITGEGGRELEIQNIGFVFQSEGGV